MARSATDTADEVHVYEPHRAGIPPLVPYFRGLWARREFAAEFSKSGIRAANTQTVFGQLWLVLNPLLLALVYYFLIAVLRGGDSGGLPRLANLTGGLFLFTFVAGSMSSGASSVTGGGRLIMNMNFPRLLMPFAAVRTAWFRFLPTLPVYVLLHLLSGAGWSWTMLLSVVFLGYAVVFAMGIAALLATLQVYFRDTSSFLPYFSRIWLYVSPILWAVHDTAGQFGTLMAINRIVNPLYSIVGGWVELSLNGVMPSPTTWVMGAVWAVVMFVVGSLLFMSRERDFTVRL
ncbi:ABC transporter permease [Pseudactinotalea suaedae]|uniref:ABC transporter permease n=1 Tax=Pseudactinotalea suaedae TaxID=1524924 RepID=UPI0012E1B315|nr:ABC transporter permease [Pseudactinotalea suaedae]